MIGSQLSPKAMKRVTEFTALDSYNHLWTLMNRGDGGTSVLHVVGSLQWLDRQACVLLVGDKVHELPMLERGRYVFARNSLFVFHFGDRSRSQKNKQESKKKKKKIKQQSVGDFGYKRLGAKIVEENQSR